MKPHLLLLGALLAPAAAAQDDEEQERARVVFHFDEIQPGGSAEKALAAYNEWTAAGADPDKLPAAMAAIYDAAGGGAAAFKKVAHLVAKGLKPDEVADKSLAHLQISEAHSKQMARIREAEIKKVIHEILLSKKGEWKIGRSDSGNPDSGMKSDLDQTLYVLKKGPHGQWVRDPDADRQLIEEFNRRFSFIGIDALDIASIEGKQRFPDPRDVHLDFEGKFLETIDALRRTPGAYTYPGAVVSQMQLRALLATLQNRERSFMEYELGAKGELKELAFDQDYAKRILFGIRPALMPGHAYGAAVANYLTLQTYLKNGKIDPKYHLRVWDDCGQLLAMVEGRLQGGLHEYLELPADEAARRNKAVVDTMFADATQRKRHKLALDASAKLRLIHKGGDNLARVFGATVPPPAEYDSRVFADLARELYELKPSEVPTEKQIKGAVIEHRRLASEFCLESVFKSAAECFKLYRDVRFQRPLSVEGYRHLLRLENDADWPKVRKNLEFMSRTTFLYSLYDLGFWKSTKLMMRLREQFPDLGRLEVAELLLKGSVQNLVAPLRNAALRKAMINDLHKQLSLEIDLQDFTTRGFKANLGSLNERVQRRVLVELGFQNVEGAEMVGRLLQQKKLSWSPSKFAKNALWDPGSLDALAQIARAFVLSDGDLEHVKAVALNELIFAIPVAGQIYSLSQGGVQGAVLMAGAIQFPPFGIALVVYSIGEAGYAIYDAGYAEHVRNNVLDALYRGFTGPATRAYDGAPQQFTAQDGKLLTILGRRLARAKEQNNAAATEELAPRVARLQQRKQAWKSFRDGSWAGNYWYEWGAQEEQKPIKVSLLMDVPPVISFSPQGIIDFRAQFDARDQKRLEALEAIVKGAEQTADYERYLRAAAELDELSLQRDRHARARRYLGAAEGRSRTGLSAREQRQGVPELLHKIRRDSLYPALLDRAVRLQDEKGNLSTPNPDTFVDDWIKAVGDWAVRELNDQGVSSDDVGDLARRGLLGSASLVDQLKQRLHQDYVRSKHIYERFLAVERNRKQVAKLRLQRRIDLYEAARTGLAVEGFDLSRMTAALALSAVRRKAPTVDADVLVVRKKHAKKMDPKREQAEVTVRVRLKLDQHVYPGPYSWVLHRLDRAAAGAAMRAGRLRDPDVPLLADSQAKLRTLLAQAGKDPVMIPVVSVFSQEMLDLSAALPPTVAHLPRERTARGVLLGQTVPVGTPEPAAEEATTEPVAEAAEGPARLMIGRNKSAGRRTARLRPKTEYAWEAPSAGNCTPGPNYGKAFLWIELPERPPQKRIVIDWHVAGCIPRVEKKVRTSVAHLGRDEFGVGRGQSSGKRFTIPIPVRGVAGDLRVHGQLMVFGARQKWRDPTVQPESSVPFDLTLRCYPPAIEASGSATWSSEGHVWGSIQLKNLQSGRRTAKIEVGGRTVYAFGRLAFFVPYATAAPKSAKVTLRNYGRDVTVAVPLQARTSKREKVNSDLLARARATIDRLLAQKDGRDRNLFKIESELGTCVRAFTLSDPARVIEPQGIFKYKREQIAVSEEIYRGSASAGWRPYQWQAHQGKPFPSVPAGSRSAAVREFHGNAGARLANRYADVIRAGYEMRNAEVVEEFTRRAEALARELPRERRFAESWRTAQRGYASLARIVFAETGSFERANALHKKSVALRAVADELVGNRKQKYPELLYQPDPSFDPGR